ncbi:uncharacterized protein LOC124127333 [Haliotis rufescens]|uniref:uncharacterized protein LOC124127333 n=1 Tax=Haliotis rufescens TaxID=6454 RepID=UPI00201EB74D|nr:uncharacterized protein LOC124127333 [Haliotis rufescens]
MAHRSKHLSKRVVLFIAVILICIVCVYHAPFSTILPPPAPAAVVNNTCPSVLDHMTQGQWITRPLSLVEKRKSEDFYALALQMHGVPASLQRPDGQCGNQGYSQVSPFIRAMCSPTGTTPCCFNFRCKNVTEDLCRCPNCWDLRQSIHAEYSTWRTGDPRCSPQETSEKEICRLLDGAYLYFIGDSLIRHMYTGLLMAIRHNFEDGGLRSTEDADIKKRCSGMNMYEEKLCRAKLPQNVTELCGGRVRLRFTPYYNFQFSKQFQQAFFDAPRTKRSYFVVGIGFHVGLDSNSIYNHYLKPVLDFMTKQPWPKLMWMHLHAPSSMKRSNTQNEPQVIAFNERMSKLLKPHGIPIMPTYNMTIGVRSFDGTHYGIGINVLKAKIFINYLKELQTKGIW